MYEGCTSCTVDSLLSRSPENEGKPGKPSTPSSINYSVILFVDQAKTLRDIRNG